MIPIQKFTTKSQEALQKTHRFVFENNQDTIDPLHLTLTLSEQEDGVVLSILKKLGTDVNTLKRQLLDDIHRLPKISGEVNINQIVLSGEMNRALLNSEKEAANLRDEYISTEHLLLGIMSTRTKAGEILKRFGVDYERVLKILVEVRGSHRITDP